MHSFLSRSAVVLVVLGATGCKEYFSVEEACHPEGAFRGMDNLKGEDKAAVNYINCHRRVIGFDRAGVAKELVEASTNVFNYVNANPDLYGPQGNSVGFLSQQGARPEFTGTEVYERLSSVDYRLLDATGVRVEELIGIVPNEEYVGRDAIELAMKAHWAQETILMPSVRDVGYAGGVISAEWWEASGYKNLDDTVPTTGTFLYLIVVSEMPPSEGANDVPVIYPKRDQTAVPLTGFNTVDRYQPDLDLNGVVEGDEITTLSYPIMVGYTSAITQPSSGGLYDLSIISATIHGPNGPIPTVWASPGEVEPPNNRLASVTGVQSYWAGGVYATEPFEPSTEYTVYVDSSSVDGPVSHSVSFTTAAQDPLYGPSGTLTRSRRAASRSPALPFSQLFGRQQTILP